MYGEKVDMIFAGEWTRGLSSAIVEPRCKPTLEEVVGRRGQAAGCSFSGKLGWAGRVAEGGDARLLFRLDVSGSGCDL